MIANAPPNETDRLQALHAYQVLDTLPEQAYDDIVRLASFICSTPIALVSMVDENRQWFKARLGMDLAQTARDISFCAHALAQMDELLIIQDTQADSRFTDNPMVWSAPHIRFYAGAPLLTSTRQVLGTLCVLDYTPRDLSPEQKFALSALARQVVAQLELRRKTNRLELLSTTDALTELPNRHASLGTLQEEFDRSQRYALPLSFLLVEIDQFKQLNAKSGRAVGEDILKSVAGVLRKEARSHDTVGRYGDSTFAVILPSTGKDDSIVVAERLRRAVETLSLASRITISVGMSSLNLSMSEVAAMTDAGILVNAASAGLEQAKRNGSNQVCEAP